MLVWGRLTRGQAPRGLEGSIEGMMVLAKQKEERGDAVWCLHAAQEFAGSDKWGDLYAGTPPLSATRYILPDRVPRGRQGTQRRKLMVLDIQRAFLHGMCTRSIYIERRVRVGEICGHTYSRLVRDP